nr:MAG TPA: hypothetical protein [Caudoviricetes sp.]
MNLIIFAIFDDVCPPVNLFKVTINKTHKKRSSSASIY